MTKTILGHKSNRFFGATPICRISWSSLPRVLAGWCLLFYMCDVAGLALCFKLEVFTLIFSITKSQIWHVVKDQPLNISVQNCKRHCLFDSNYSANFSASRFSTGFFISAWTTAITTLWVFVIVLTVQSCFVLSFLWHTAGQTVEPIFTLYTFNDVS